jgi:hypothetical protein
VQRRGGHGRTERADADTTLGQPGREGVQRQAVVLVRRARQQHRPASRQLGRRRRDVAQDDGRAVGQQVLHLDALAGGRPARTHRDEHGAQDVVPGVQHAVLGDLLADEGRHRVRVEGHGRASEPPRDPVRPGHRQDASAWTTAAGREPARAVRQGCVVRG